MVEGEEALDESDAASDVFSKSKSSTGIIGGEEALDDIVQASDVFSKSKSSSDVVEGEEALDDIVQASDESDAASDVFSKSKSSSGIIGGEEALDDIVQASDESDAASDVFSKSKSSSDVVEGEETLDDIVQASDESDAASDVFSKSKSSSGIIGGEEALDDIVQATDESEEASDVFSRSKSSSGIIGGEKALDDVQASDESDAASDVFPKSKSSSAEKTTRKRKRGDLDGSSDDECDHCDADDDDDDDYIPSDTVDSSEEEDSIIDVVEGEEALDDIVQASDESDEASDVFPMLSTERAQLTLTGNTETGSVFIKRTSNTKEKRKWDRKNICMYCSEPKAKLPRHFVEKHSNELLVAKFSSLPKCSKDRKILLEEMTNKGNFIHNSKVLESGHGEIIPFKRPSQEQKVSVNAFSPCEYCLGFFIKTDLWKHQKHCHSKPNDEKRTLNRSVKARSALLLPACDSESEKLRDILATMNDDEVTHIVRKDPLILHYGEKLLKVGNEQHNRHFISQKMRELGRFLLKIREMEKSVMSLDQAIVPGRFLKNVDAVKALAGYDKDLQSYKIPSLALKVGMSLKKCCKIIKAQALLDGDTKRKQEVDDFYELCEMEWSDRVSISAYQTLKEKKWNKPTMLPLVEDIVSLQNHLKKLSSTLSTELIQNATEKVWHELAKVILCQVTLFNRRRSGETSRIKVADYSLATKGTDEEINNYLTPLEKKLCNQFFRLEVKGKRGNKVPILLTDETKSTIDLLMETRKSVEILPENVYVFAVPKSVNYIRCSASLRKYSYECGAKYPDKITSTKLRKHIATLSQLYNLKKNEMDILAQFMGHDIRVHRNFYRLPQDTLQMATVSKILLALEEGSVGNFRGKSLEEIKLNMDVVEEDEDGDSESEGFDHHEDCADESDVYSVQQRAVIEGDEDGDSESEGFDHHEDCPDESICPVQQRAEILPKRRSKRVPWTDSEKRAVKAELGQFISKLKVPGKLDCDKCLKIRKELSRRSWKDIKNFVHNTIQTVKRKYNFKN